jgi:hypothetical protein
MPVLRPMRGIEPTIAHHGSHWRSTFSRRAIVITSASLHTRTPLKPDTQTHPDTYPLLPPYNTLQNSTKRAASWWRLLLELNLRRRNASPTVNTTSTQKGFRKELAPGHSVELPRDDRLECGRTRRAREVHVADQVVAEHSVVPFDNLRAPSLDRN